MKKLTQGRFGVLPKLSLYTIFAMTFGFFGVNAVENLQLSQMSRVFQTIGANPTQLGFFWLLPPMMGMVVQPLVGKYSDTTWGRLGRRMPYLLIGMPLTVLVMILFPNAGSFGFGYGSFLALTFGVVTVAILEVSNNVCMQPFKMIIGDMVNNKQQDVAWSWQQVFANLGGLFASFLPFLLTFFGMKNTSLKGEVPPSVKAAFYFGAAVEFITVIYTICSVKEYDPKEYAFYHGIKATKATQKSNFWQLLKHAPREFWQICLVQLFTWIAFLFLNTYGTGTLAQNIWHTSNPSSAGFQAAGNWFGIMNVVLAVGGVLFGTLVLARIKVNRRKFWYTVGIFTGGVGLISVFFVHDKWLMILPFLLISVGQITMNVEPFALFTQSLNGVDEGYYLGIFNCGICIPQIVAALIGGPLLKYAVNGSMPMMFVIAGVITITGSFFVRLIGTAPLKNKFKNKLSKHPSARFPNGHRAIKGAA